MFKRFFTLAIFTVASAGLAAAAEPSCPAIVVAPSAMQYVAVPCMQFFPAFDGPAQCLNCPGMQSVRGLNGTAVCMRTIPDYSVRRIERHFVNGRCVPIESALRARTLADPSTPRLERPVQAPPMLQAPRPERQAPRLDPPRFAPPAAPRPAAEHAVRQGGRPQP